MECKLIIRDECNVKLEGLELTHRKDLVNKFKYEVPGAKYQPAVRLGRWDGKVSLFALGGTSFVNLLPEILPYVIEKGYDVVCEDLRDYRTQYDFDPVHVGTWQHKVWPKGHPVEGQPISLRDYQIEIVNKFLANPQCIQEVATGAGKTLMTAALSASVEKYGRSIIIVPNRDLVTQTEADYRNMGLDVGVYFGGRHEFGHTHTICTWQSLNNLLKGTQTGEVEYTIGEFIEGVVCIMVDEAHMAKSDVLKTLLTGVFAKVPIRWGLTGTVPKDDASATSLKVSLGDVVGKLAAATLQEDGHLSNCHVNVLQLIDHAEYREYQQELKYLTENTERIAYMARLILKIRESGNTLILVDRIATGKLLQTELSSLTSLLSDKPEVAFISGITKSKDRKEEYDSVATDDNRITIATFGVAAVGINIPRIFNLVLVEPGKSFVRVIQSIGRGLRKAQDKDHVEIYDITSTCKFAKRHLTTRKKFYTEAQYPFTVEKVDWKK